MPWLGVLAAIALILIVLVDTFEVMILPRRVAHAFRPARLFYQVAWSVWRTVAAALPSGKWRHGFLSVFGPLSVFALVILWAVSLIFGFALLNWSLDTAMASAHDDRFDFSAYLYFSGTTFFTLGYGDLVPTSRGGRILGVLEAGIGFAFLAVVISFLPVLYQAFSRREIVISLFDARAGSPPTAAELLRRAAEHNGIAGLGPVLLEWEHWSAEVLESHLSYPVLRYYRSQHDNQSWIGALTTILDTSSLMIALLDGEHQYQTRLTFAMARHAAVDLSLVAQTAPLSPKDDRLPPALFQEIRDRLTAAGLTLRDSAAAEKSLTELRRLYEPFVQALADYFQFSIPDFGPRQPPVDNWQKSAWMPRSPGIDRLSAGRENEHF